jgi:hypothetical protein
MPAEIPPNVRQLFASQGHVITRSQAIALGLSASTIRNRVRGGDWQQLQFGVYADFTGTPKRDAQIWAALLRAGPGAALSHWTAAERHGLVDRPAAAIHLAVPVDCHPARWAAIPGVVIHRTRRLDRAIHPADEQWRDKDRDRWNAVHQKIDTIRIGTLALRTPQAQCATAADVATWLSGRGPATGHPCTRAGCPVPPSAE